MRVLRKIGGVLLLLGLGALLRLPLEAEFRERLVERELVPPDISLGVYADLRQSSFAGVLGGLRAVVASLTHLEAHEHFANQEWFELKRDYETIVALDPFNQYYWEAGGWHLAYNAASDARGKTGLKEVEKRLLEREFLEEGDEFYRNGAEVLAGEGHLWTSIGRLWSNPFKRPDFEKAAEAFQKAYELGGRKLDERSLVYALAQIPGRQKEAWELIDQVVQKDPGALRFPTMASLYFVLSRGPWNEEKEWVSVEAAFGSRERAREILANYRDRLQRTTFPRYGLLRAIQELN